MIKTNFHTHTNFCDGADTAEDMVLTAIEKGFTHLGFSDHSYVEGDSEWTLNPNTVRLYISTINSLKQKYGDKLNIFCGIEQDTFSKPNKDLYEYVIGSVHALIVKGKYASIDNNLKDIERVLNEGYNGSFEGLAKDYFSQMERVVDITEADIIGHLDVITKFSQILGIEESEGYLELAERAVEKLVKYNIPFEINTGAMARGYKTEPYPSTNLLKMIKDRGGKICFSSDCHKKEFLDCGFDKAEKLALSLGFKEHAIITKDGLKYIKMGE